MSGPPFSPVYRIMYADALRRIPRRMMIMMSFPISLISCNYYTLVLYIKFTETDISKECKKNREKIFNSRLYKIPIILPSIDT